MGGRCCKGTLASCLFSLCNVVMSSVSGTRAPSAMSTGSDVQVRHLIVGIEVVGVSL